MSQPSIREELRRIGKRRETLKAKDEELARDAEEVLKRAHGEVPVTEAANLTKMHRTTVYRVYLGQGHTPNAKAA